jgi:hypothetical protein
MRLCALQEGYDEHIHRMISGPAVVLLLQKSESKESSVDDFRDLIHSNEEWKSMIDCTQSADHAQQSVVVLTDLETDLLFSFLSRSSQRAGVTLAEYCSETTISCGETLGTHLSSHSTQCVEII